jgi:MoaA/NifB/PqqE/SkfB family radical SAM enzyme
MALHLPINGSCNIKCVFCSAWGRSKGFGLEHLKAKIDADVTGHVQISGGDPLLKDPLELLAILKHCKSKGKIVEFQTNAVLVPGLTERFLKALLALVDFFNVNFSAHTPELDLLVTETPGAFDKRLAGVRRLLGMGATVRLTYIVHGANFRRCEEFVRYVKDSLPRISWIQFSYVKGMGRAKGEKRVIPSYRVAAPYLNAAMGLCRRSGLRFEVDHIPVCFVRDFKEQHADYRKMRARSPGIHLEEKRPVAECDGCGLRPYCPGPRVDYIEVHRAL